MNRIAHGVVVEKTSQGCRVEGYLDNERVITITNCNISVVKQGDNWAVLVDGSNESPESKNNKEEAVSMAKFFKESYEKRGVIVKYDEE